MPSQKPGRGGRLSLFRRGNPPLKEIGVWPRDEDVRRFLYHPLDRRRFPNYPDASPWPDDQFTKRRIVEGAILTEPPKALTAPAPKPPVLDEEQEPAA